ncbi:hypothetical protein P7C73_g843, partial [Tremellales sp. Uapishka_1]
MATDTSHHILHRMVPLICQALTTSPTDETVWLEGLRLLSSPKLRTAMSLTSSIWLPLLLKGLEPTRPRSVVLAALRLLTEVAEVLEPMKSCLLKPLRVLGRDRDIDSTEELVNAVEKLGLMVKNTEKKEIARPKVPIESLATTPLAQEAQNPRDHPLLAEILSRNLPIRPKTVRQAWTQTLLSSTHENTSVWLTSLFQATLEASAVPEMVITSRLGPLVNSDMFQTAFLKCYIEIAEDPSFKKSIDDALIQLFSDTTLSQDIGKELLNLLAFFDKEGMKVPDSVLEAAKICALSNFKGDLNQPLPGIVLWYAEQEASTNLSAANLSNLVEANIRVGPAGFDSAWSSLLWLSDDYEHDPEPRWITQLSHWATALEAQDEIDRYNPTTTFSSLNTRMICHHALGEYERGYELAQLHFEGLNDHERRKAAHWVTAAAWHMGDYESMGDYLAFHPKGTSKSLYKAIIDVHDQQYASAFHHISKAQTLGYDEIQAVGPQVALKSLAKTELLVELQEVIQYKSQPDLRQHILAVWRSRFKRSHADANSWLKRLQVWTLACPPTQLELQDCYLDCAKLCESTRMHAAAQRIISLVTPPVHIAGCKVAYTQLRFQYKAASARRDTEGMNAVLGKMHAHIEEFMDSVEVKRDAIENEGLGLQPLLSVQGLAQNHKATLSRRFHRLAQWTEVMQGADWLTDPNSVVYRYYSLAHKLDTAWFTAGNALAQAAMNVFEANNLSKDDPAALNGYVVPAVRGLFQAIRSDSTPERKIRALLRLVTLWFRYGEGQAVLLEVEEQLSTTPISSWLMAIPQLIARLGTTHKGLQGVLVSLLKQIAFSYPHAVIWPLLTASQTRKVEHQDAARVIMNHICTIPEGPRLVSQAELVGRELIRASISWLEKWKSIIEHCLPRQEIMEISWVDVPDMWREELEKLSAPETPDEEQFIDQFGKRLLHVDTTLRKYQSTKQIGLVHTAYMELYNLFGEIDAQLNQWRVPGSKLFLASAAPKLLSLRDCILTVPGQYDPAIKLDDQSFIESFQPTVDVLSSKQLPRKLIIRSLRRDFTFLLKGHEDLRGDERIMQLFTLVNTLLNHESEAFSRNLHLLPYEVIPLSPEAGLLSWVPNTQTLQSIISSHREKKHRGYSLTNKEMASLLGFDPETFDPRHDNPRLDTQHEMERYDKLSHETKVARLKAALAHSDQSEQSMTFKGSGTEEYIPSGDLRDALWQRSPSAEIWIRRRTNFARTIGVGSFVGHIIGLGDRHGMNILIDQLTWGALHIDFGDLFGVAQERSYLPERVPFRLTRMMTNAFELAGSAGHTTPGSRGSFKQASLVTMGILRDGRSSLLAMLEAFLYDPLLSWTVGRFPHSEHGSTESLYRPIRPRQKAKAKESETNTSEPEEEVPAVQIKKPTIPIHIAQSVAPIRSTGMNGDSGLFNRIENSLIAAYLDPESYMAKVDGAGMTNARALHVSIVALQRRVPVASDGYKKVLAQIERKLAGRFRW